MAKKICYIKRFQLILVDYILKSTKFFLITISSLPNHQFQLARIVVKIAQDFLTENCCDFVKIR